MPLVSNVFDSSVFCFLSLFVYLLPFHLSCLLSPTACLLCLPVSLCLLSAVSPCLFITPSVSDACYFVYFLIPASAPLSPSSLFLVSSPVSYLYFPLSPACCLSSFQSIVSSYILPAILNSILHAAFMSSSCCLSLFPACVYLSPPCSLFMSSTSSLLSLLVSCLLFRSVPSRMSLVCSLISVCYLSLPLKCCFPLSNVLSSPIYCLLSPPVFCLPVSCLLSTPVSYIWCPLLTFCFYLAYFFQSSVACVLSPLECCQILLSPAVSSYLHRYFSTWIFSTLASCAGQFPYISFSFCL